MRGRNRQSAMVHIVKQTIVGALVACVGSWSLAIGHDLNLRRTRRVSRHTQAETSRLLGNVPSDLRNAANSSRAVGGREHIFKAIDRFPSAGAFRSDFFFKPPHLVHADAVAKHIDSLAIARGAGSGRHVVNVSAVDLVAKLGKSRARGKCQKCGRHCPDQDSPDLHRLHPFFLPREGFASSSTASSTSAEASAKPANPACSKAAPPVSDAARA